MEGNNKIVLITGSFPPDFCGVGDYTEKLLNALSLYNNISVEIFYKSKWGLKYLFFYFVELISKKKCSFHLQYPTEGYGYSLLPLILLIFLRLSGKVVITTVHELSSRKALAYLYTQSLILLSNKIIVTNIVDFKHSCRFIFNTNKVFLTPIASNINKSSFYNLSFCKRTTDIAYFGHIRPNKGVENFVNAISILNENLNIQLIGQVLKKYCTFFEIIRLKANLLNINLMIDNDEIMVADLLANVKIIYLPFPDGISSRRGSLLAGLQNGCVVISKKSAIEDFNNFFLNYVYLVENDEEAVDVMRKLLNNQLKPKDLTDFQNLFSWDNVVLEHLKMYNC